jgi:hypothetical protein
MNLIAQETHLPPQSYPKRRPDKFDICPSCQGPKRTHAKRCKPCWLSTRTVIPQPDDPFIRHIPLTQGQHAIVDTHLYEWLMEYRWFAQMNPHTRSYYAATSVGRARVEMHRLIMGLDKGNPRKGDHEMSGHTLDNRGSNLRPATGAQNAKNRRMNRNNRSGFKGVYPVPGGRYAAKIKVDGKAIFLGLRDTAEAAHRELYIPAASAHHGEFARLA